jgi:hypothetical protein
VAPAGSRALDRCDFGRRRSAVVVLAGFMAGVTIGMAACAACWSLGSRDIVWQAPWSSSSSEAIMFRYLSPSMVLLGLVVFALFPVAQLLAVLVAPALRVSARLWRRSRDRRGWRLPLVTALTDVSDGQWVRVRGQVIRGGGFVSAAGRAGVVIASCFGSVGTIADRGQRTRYFWELHGADFRVALAHGEELSVRVENATLRDRPVRFPPALALQRPFAPRASAPAGAPVRPPARGMVVAGLHDEQVVAAGDWVEVVGRLGRGVDPAAEVGPRGPRLHPLLESSASRRLSIRVVAPAAGGAD